MSDSQAQRGDAGELILHEELHVALKLVKLQLFVLVQVDLPINVGPNFIFDVVLVDGALIKGLADLILADSAVVVEIHGNECFLQVFLLKQALEVERCLAELIE